MKSNPNASTKANGDSGILESESMDQLDRLLIEYGIAKKIYPEVWGSMVMPRPLTENKARLRIDRIVTPSKRLEDAGWVHGPIGIEGKKPGESLGKAFAQAQDYKGCEFELVRGWHFLLDWVFLWPFESPQGDLGSLMAQNRIGVIHSNRFTPIRFTAAQGLTAIEAGTDGSLIVKPMPCGNKRGAR